MENKNQRKKQDHVALTEASVQKIHGWFNCVSTKKRGVKISRKDFVNWLIERLPDTPSNGDANALIDRFYDEEALLRQLLREVKQTKKDGQESRLEVVVRPRKADSKRESAAVPTDENTEENASVS